ncbi:MAG: sporulation protein YqfC [Hydrogenibacillus sp.]|nr:sporulation protein YqfC [Hydrogenibacillus sp.]
MKRWLGRIVQTGLGAVEWPPDVVSDLPRVTTVGAIHVYLENHRGLSFFSAEEIRFRTALGELCVQGDELVIRALNKAEAFIEGKIRAVRFTA